MSNPIAAEIQQAKELADELRQQLRLYQECIRDPEATLSLPDMNRMCQLADAISNKLESLV